MKSTRPQCDLQCSPSLCRLTTRVLAGLLAISPCLSSSANDRLAHPVSDSPGSSGGEKSAVPTSADNPSDQLSALWTATGVGETERIEPSFMQHLGIFDIDNVEVDDKGEFSAEIETTWEHYASEDSAEQELELEIQYGLSSWLSSKLTIPYVWAGPNSEEEHSAFDDLQIEFKTLLLRYHKVDIGTVTEIKFPTGSSRIGVGENFEGENKLAVSIYPNENLAFHLNAGLTHEEGNFEASQIYSLACHWLITEQLHLQSEYRIEGFSHDEGEEIDYHVLINYISGTCWEAQLAFNGEHEDSEDKLEFGPGIIMEWPIGESAELQFNLGAFIGVTKATENHGIRGQLSLSF